LTFTMWSITLC